MSRTSAQLRDTEEMIFNLPDFRTVRSKLAQSVLLVITTQMTKTDAPAMHPG